MSCEISFLNLVRQDRTDNPPRYTSHIAFSFGQGLIKRSYLLFSISFLGFLRFCFLTKCEQKGQRTGKGLPGSAASNKSHICSETTLSWRNSQCPLRGDSIWGLPSLIQLETRQDLRKSKIAALKKFPEKGRKSLDFPEDVLCGGFPQSTSRVFGEEIYYVTKWNVPDITASTNSHASHASPVAAVSSHSAPSTSNHQSDQYLSRS